MKKFIPLVSLAVVLSSALANADAIVKLQNTNGSPYINLSDFLSGNDVFDIPPSAGSINIHNDLGLSTLAFYYYGSTGTEAGATIRCQNFNFGAGNTTCSVFDPSTGTSYLDGAKTPNHLPLASYKYTFSFPAAVTDFNLAWSSFSNSDVGCIAGTATCDPVAPITPTPEAASLALLVTGLISISLAVRRNISGRRPLS